MQLSGRVAVITGGGSGIGEATVKLFVSQGATVVIVDRNEQQGQRVAAAMGKDASSVMFVQADISSEADVKRVVDLAVQTFGRIDVLVNNAGTILPKPLEAIEEEEWTHLVNVNLKSVYLMTKHSIMELRKTKGVIVNMSSLNGLVGQKQNAAYAATKGGIIAMTKSLAIDYAPDGVRVNCVCPAGVMTPLLDDWILEQANPQEARSLLDSMHPLGRTATADEIAQAILFLASEQSSFMTGVALPVEGGASLGY